MLVAKSWILHIHYPPVLSPAYWGKGKSCRAGKTLKYGCVKCWYEMYSRFTNFGWICNCRFQKRTMATFFSCPLVEHVQAYLIHSYHTGICEWRTWQVNRRANGIKHTKPTHYQHCHSPKAHSSSLSQTHWDWAELRDFTAHTSTEIPL